jgi:hypothetical protein
VEENVNMPHALLSRFDLMWLILDKPNEELVGGRAGLSRAGLGWAALLAARA